MGHPCKFSGVSLAPFLPDPKMPPYSVGSFNTLPQPHHHLVPHAPITTFSQSTHKIFLVSAPREILVSPLGPLCYIVCLHLWIVTLLSFTLHLMFTYI